MQLATSEAAVFESVWPCDLSSELTSYLLGKAKLIDVSNNSDLTEKLNEGFVGISSGIITPCMISESSKTITGVVLGKGCWLGDTGLKPVPHPHMQLEIVEPATAIFISKSECKNAVEKSHEAYKWLWYASTEMSVRWLQAQVLSKESILPRIAYLLLDIAVHQGSTSRCSFPITLSQFQISNMTGISRSRVNEALKEFERENQIIVNRSSITITDFYGLGNRLTNVDLSFRDPRAYLAVN